jgi:hypothetical protein
MLQIVNLLPLQDLMIHGSQLCCGQFTKSHRPELKITAQLESAVRQHLIQHWHLS